MPLTLGNQGGVRQYTMLGTGIAQTAAMAKQDLLAQLDTAMNSVDAGEVLVITIKRVE